MITATYSFRGKSIIIVAWSTVAGRCGAREVAESYILTHKQRKKRH